MRRGIGMVFRKEGRWYRQGKLRPVVLMNRFDTTGAYAGARDSFCPECMGDQAHTLLMHYVRAREGRSQLAGWGGL